MNIGHQKALKSSRIRGQDNIYSDLTAGRIDAAFRG